MSAFPDPKSVIKSKTVWANIIGASVFAFLPHEWTIYLPYVMTGVNIVLRFISHGKVELV